jgi:hypothetical protein
LTNFDTCGKLTESQGAWNKKFEFKTWFGNKMRSRKRVGIKKITAATKFDKSFTN